MTQENLKGKRQRKTASWSEQDFISLQSIVQTILFNSTYALHFWVDLIYHVVLSGNHFSSHFLNSSI